MNRTSTAVGKKLIGQLVKSKKDDFIDKCYELLELFYTDLSIDYELNVIVQGDSESCDVFYCLATDSNALSIEDFDHTHIPRVFNRFQNINHLMILYNKNLIDKNIRDANRRFILEIHNRYGLTSLESFTPNALVEYIFAKTRDVLYATIDEANQKFKTEFQQRLSQEKIYIENVPFQLEHAIHYNPKNYIYENFIHEQDSSSKSWTFVVSEFGFGKTSLLVNLPTLGEHYRYIYIPIAQFHRNAFSNETELAKNILEIIFSRTMDSATKIIDKIFVTEFRQLLRFQKDIILLYDGLDEYHISYTEMGLKQIFTCSTSFVCNSIFTVRKEFVDERRGNFEMALDIHPKPKYSSINLLEWENKEILLYLDRLKEANNNPAAINYLEIFEKLIRQNKYNEVYGDIPKRPLFLKMLCDDIISGDTQIKNIAQLYESYLTKKFILDREGSVFSSNSKRPLSIHGDIYLVTDYIFELLAKVAWKMITITSYQAIYDESIDEKSIINLMDSEYKEIDALIELLLNSVLVPFDKRERRVFKAKFAHKSFQEYFVAYYLIFVLFGEKSINISALLLSYSKGTMDFCKYMIRDVDGLGDKIDELYIKSNVEADSDSLLYRLATVDAHINKSTLRDAQIIDEKEYSEEYDFFVSHSSQDKIPFVEELVIELKNQGLRIFYDKDSIDSSDNIVFQINQGFIRLKYGVIVVISPNFIESGWCNEELYIAYSLKVDQEKKLIPILLNISHNEMVNKYAILRSIKSINTKKQQVSSIAFEIATNRV
jgi:hypothetical protein